MQSFERFVFRERRIGAALAAYTVERYLKEIEDMK